MRSLQVYTLSDGGLDITPNFRAILTNIARIILYPSKLFQEHTIKKLIMEIGFPSKSLI